MKVGIVGLGHVGWSVGAGLALLKSDYAVVGCDKNLDKREVFRKDTGFETDGTSDRLLSDCDLILLCVRTNQVRDWLNAHRARLGPDRVLVCLSAGITVAQIGEAVGTGGPQIHRAITNINVAVRSGLTVLLDRASKVTQMRWALVERLFIDLGQVIKVESESELDSLSVLPGCAPAVTAIFVQGLRNFGVTSGFDADAATRIAVQCIGATAKLFQQTGLAPEELKRRVAAPGGVVDRLLSAPESDLIEKAVSDWLEAVLRHLVRRE